MSILGPELVGALEMKYGPLWWPEDMYPEGLSSDPFKRIIITVLSQNTSEANCIRAYKGLATEFEITPEALARADREELKEAIRSGGLYNVKSKRIRQLSRVVLEEFDGDFKHVLSLPKEEAKKKLVELPGIGNKTADVVLTDTYSYREVIPIDTHYNRLAKRLGLVRQKANYKEIQKAMIDFIPKDKRDRVAGLLWLLAKHTCKPQNPRCRECLISQLCAYEEKTGSARK
ncbi:MAG: endonuclease III [Candidatus Bathyarchaeota archaeon]|nr:MAG: endonuclease III [Candidatus Bathyarchaeota archaeon]